MKTLLIITFVMILPITIILLGLWLWYRLTHEKTVMPG